MSKLTSKDKEKIVEGLIEVFKKYEAEKSVLFYYDNLRVRVNETGEIIREEGFNPRDYFEFVMKILFHFPSTAVRYMRF